MSAIIKNASFQIVYRFEKEDIRDFYGKTLYQLYNGREIRPFACNTIYRIEPPYAKHYAGAVILKREGKFIKDFYGRIVYIVENNYIKDEYFRIIYVVDGQLQENELLALAILTYENK